MSPEENIQRVRRHINKSVRSDEILSACTHIDTVRDDKSKELWFKIIPAPNKLTLEAHIPPVLLPLSNEELTAKVNEGLDRAREQLITMVARDLEEHGSRRKSHRKGYGGRLTAMPRSRDRLDLAIAIQVCNVTFAAIGGIGGLVVGQKLGIHSAALRDLVAVVAALPGYNMPSTLYKELTTRLDDMVLAHKVGEPLVREGLEKLQKDKRAKDGRQTKKEKWAARVKDGGRNFFDGMAVSIEDRVNASARRQYKPRGRGRDV